MNGTTKNFYLPLMAASMLLVSCSRETPNERADSAAATPAASTVSDATPAPAQPAASADSAMSADAALAVVAAVDEHEIAAAEQARSKQVKGGVLDYANMLHREHTANLQAGQALASAMPGARNATPEAEAMRSKGRDELTMLDGKSGADYQKAYVDAMVKGHGEVLTMLETRLIPAATDERVRQFLTNSRDHVAMHLERGKALQSAP